jgi:hypothetical protein
MKNEELDIPGFKGDECEKQDKIVDGRWEVL